MPVISADDLALLRRQPHRSDLYLIVHQPLIILSAQVTGAAVDNTQITIAGGAYGTDACGNAFASADLVSHLTIWVGSSAGARDLGLTRYRGNLSAPADPPTLIAIAENDDIDWTNAYISIVDEIRILPIFPRTPLQIPPTDVDWYKDYDLTYAASSNANSKFRPIPIMGPPAVAFLDAATVTTQWDGNDSYTIRTGAAIGTYAWSSNCGTVLSAATAATGIRYGSVTGHAGDRIALQVTDNVGGDTRSLTGYRRAYIMSRTGPNAPYGAGDTEIELLSLGGLYDAGGYTMEIQVRDGSPDGSGRPDIDKFQDGNQVILYSEDYYGGTKDSIGSLANRETILFVGFIVGNSVIQNARTGAVTFTAEGIQGVLDRCDMYPVALEDATTAQTTEWYKMEDLNVQRVLHHSFLYHSTVHLCTDLFLPDYSISGSPWIHRSHSRAAGWEFTQQSLYAMANANVMQSALLGKCGSDKFGRLFMERDVQVLDNGQYAPTYLNERAGIPTVMKILKQDQHEPIEIEETSEARTSQVRLSGVVWPGGGIEDDPDLEDLEALFSYAPGDCMKTRGSSRDQPNLALDNQDQANSISGMLLAKDNNRYPIVRVPLNGNYRAFDIMPQEYVTMDLLAGDTNRGIEWSNRKLVVRGLEFEYRAKPGTLLTTLTLEPETHGKPGETIIFPDQPPEDDDYDPPDPPDPPGPGPYPGWRKKIYAATNDLGIFYTEDFSGPGEGQPTWWTVNEGLGSLATRGVVGDSWNPSYRQYTRTLEPKIYRKEGGGSWSVILDLATVVATTGIAIAPSTSWTMAGPACSMNAQGHVYALVWYMGIDNFKRLYFFKSVNYGDNWVAVLLAASTIFVGGPIAIRVGSFKGSSPYPAGHVIYAVYQPGTTGFLGIFVSVDQGATFGGGIYLASCGSSGQDGDFAVSPADQDVVYSVARGTQIGVGPLFRFDKSTNRGGAFSSIWACALSPTMGQRPSVYIWGPNDAYMVAHANLYRVHHTTTDWASYTSKTNAIKFNVDWLSRVMDSPHLLYLGSGTGPSVGIGESPHVIGVSDDEGATVEGKAGTNCNTPPYTDAIPVNCEGVSGILQIWTE